MSVERRKNLVRQGILFRRPMYMAVLYCSMNLPPLDKEPISKIQCHGGYCQNILVCRVERNPVAKARLQAVLCNLALLHVRYLGIALGHQYSCDMDNILKPFTVSIIHHVACRSRVNEMRPAGQSPG
jgi:hypothetical protein